MANHDPNHSSHQRTILWVIVPVAVALTLLFTRQNGKAPALREELDGNVTVKKALVEKKVSNPAVTDTITMHPATAPAVHGH